jgi:hypothetical protein
MEYAERQLLTIPAADYHAARGINSGSIIAGLRSMRHMEASLSRPEREPSRSMIVGSALHILALEPNRASEIVTAPDVDRRTKAGKEQWEAFHAGLAAGTLVLTADEASSVHAMAATLRDHRIAADLLREGKAEQSIFWTRRTLGSIETYLCKARLDWIVPDGTILDIKTTRDASPQAFAKAAASYKYAHQAAWYWDALAAAANEGHAPKPKRYIIAAVENVAPYDVALYELTQDDLDLGRMDLVETLGQWAREQERGDRLSGPIEDDRMQLLRIPPWSWKHSFGGAFSKDEAIEQADGDDVTIPF